MSTYNNKGLRVQVLSLFCPHIPSHSCSYLYVYQVAVIIIFIDSDSICGEISHTSELTFSGSTSRSYGSCAGEVHTGSGARSGTSTTPTQLLETTPLVASCASEHSSASPISGDLPTARVPTSGSVVAPPLVKVLKIFACVVSVPHRLTGWCPCNSKFHIKYTNLHLPELNIFEDGVLQ